MESKTVRIPIPTEYRELYNPAWRVLAYHGGRFSLKSYNVGLSLLIRGRKDRKRWLCTREIQNTIKDSVHKLLSDQIERYGFTDYEVTNDSIRNTITGTEFIFRGLHHNINEIKSLEGIDGAWVEEAQSITKESLDILTPTIRKPGSQLIFTFNRLTELDPVYVKYVMHPPANTYSKQVNYDIAIKYGLMPNEIMSEIENDKVNDPDLYTHKWLGQPLAQAERAIISRNAILDAMQREVDDEGAVEIGADIARMGDDRTVFRKRKGFKSIETKTYTKLRTTEVCDKLEAFAGYDKTVLLKIDDTGVGGGVTDEMIKRGYLVMAVNFGAKAQDPDKYPNLISEAWFYLASIIDTIQIEMDSDLLMELSSRLWKMDSKGRRGVEGKDDYKKRGYRSPDKADALILCFYSMRPEAFEYEPEEVVTSFTSGLLDTEF
jgi:phage terminase large subunit